MFKQFNFFFNQMSCLQEYKKLGTYVVWIHTLMFILVLKQFGSI